MDSSSCALAPEQRFEDPRGLGQSPGVEDPDAEGARAVAIGAIEGVAGGEDRHDGAAGGPFGQGQQLVEGARRLVKPVLQEATVARPLAVPAKSISFATGPCSARRG